MDEINSFQRANHYLELCDVAFVVPRDHIHSVYENPFDLGLEFENGIGISDDLTNI